jgi:molybdopterin converting factor small subunit
LDDLPLTVHVHYFSILADYVLAKDADLTIKPGTSVGEFLTYLSEVNPPAFKNIIMNGASRGSFVRIFKNGELVAEENEQALLADGDEFKLFPAISGG